MTVCRQSNIVYLRRALSRQCNSHHHFLWTSLPQSDPGFLVTEAIWISVIEDSGASSISTVVRSYIGCISWTKTSSSFTKQHFVVFTSIVAEDVIMSFLPHIRSFFLQFKYFTLYFICSPVYPTFPKLPTINTFQTKLIINQQKSIKMIVKNPLAPYHPPQK